MCRELENNKVALSGTGASNLKYSHTVFGEKFYLFDLEVKRLSQSTDIIPIMVSERMIDVSGDWVGQILSIKGQFRSYNKHEDDKSKLILSVFAREIEVLGEIPFLGDGNSIFLDGYICKEPVYRKTALGREISDLLLAVNRPYGKSDYIPCICWGRNARFVSTLEVGTRLQLDGRIQSREYQKKLDDGTAEIRTAYEVSVSKVSVVEESEETNE